MKSQKIQTQKARHWQNASVAYIPDLLNSADNKQTIFNLQIRTPDNLLVLAHLT